MSIGKQDNNLSVIIVTYNSAKHIRRCINSLVSYSQGKTVNNIYVIDNNSRDKTIKIINDLSNKLIFLKNKSNIGFAKAVNQVLGKINSEFILLLNPDTRLQRDSLSRLIACMKLTGAGICGGKMVKTTGKSHGSYVRKPDLLTGLFDFTNLKKIFPDNKWHKKFYFLNARQKTNRPLAVDAVSGGYMLIQKRVIQKIGLFDESFFMYLEDVDFCLRAKSRGFKIFYCPSSIIWHEGGASSKNKDKINYKAWTNSRKYFYWKHASFLENIIIQPSFLIDKIITDIWRFAKNKQ